MSQSLSERARAILDAAEPPAAADLARLLRLVHDTLALAGETHRRGEALGAALLDVTARLEAAARALTATAASAAAAPAPAPEAAPPPRADEPDPARVRLVAIEHAVAGATRREVGRHLQEELGVADPTRVLDDVFGSGSEPGARLSWGRPDAPAA